MTIEEPSDQLRLQWTRNEVIGYLRLVASYDEQRRYQENVPFVSVSIELIVQWEDCVWPEWRTSFLPPVFSDRERQAIEEYGRVWEDVADEGEFLRCTLEELIGTPSWERLRATAEQALSVFMVRGTMPSDDEVRF